MLVWATLYTADWWLATASQYQTSYCTIQYWLCTWNAMNEQKVSYERCKIWAPSTVVLLEEDRQRCFELTTCSPTIGCFVRFILIAAEQQCLSNTLQSSNTIRSASTHFIEGTNKCKWNTAVTCPRIMPSFRSGILLLTFIALITKSAAQVDTETALCRKQRDQCERDAKEKNPLAMRESCQACYLNCKPLVKKPHDRAHGNFVYCLHKCEERDCIGRETSNGVPVADQFRCHVYHRRCHVDERVNSPIKKSCGTCAQVCFFPFVRHNRDFCEGRCSFRNVSCEANPGTTVDEQCSVQRAQCERDTKASNVTAMLDSCQNCYLNCAPPRVGLSDDANYCLNACVSKDCIENTTSSGVRVADQFRCLVSKRRCEQDDNLMGDRNDLIRRSCGVCANECNFPFSRQDRNYCEEQCSARNFSCVAKPRRITTKATPPPVNITLAPPKPKDSDPPAVNRPTDTFGNSTPAPKPKELKVSSNSADNKVWQWLGPVLGAAATIFGAIITVVWVRDHHAKASALVIKYPPPPHAVELGYDEGWPNPDNTTGVAELVEQNEQQPSSGWSKIFSCWQRYRAWITVTVSFVQKSLYFQLLQFFSTALVSEYKRWRWLLL